MKTTFQIFGRKAVKGAALMGVASMMAVSSVQAAEEVNVYSMRQAFLIEPILESFTQETGVKVNVFFAKKGLVERLAEEGQNSPADIVLTSSFGNTMRVVKEGLSQPVQSTALEANIPAKFRGNDKDWFALTLRARVLYTSKDRVSQGGITTYGDMADPKWQGRICTRSGTHPYNVQLFASQIAHNGEAATKSWLQGLQQNLARKPQGNDRAQVKAVMEGECDIALGNSYYYFKMLDKEEQRPWAEAVNVVFPVTEGHGTHVNVSGMVMAKYAPHPENAVKLMEFLASEAAQRIYADSNYEYPVNPAVKPAAALAALGDFTADELTLDQIAGNLETALRLVSEVGYNE